MVKKAMKWSEAQWGYNDDPLGFSALYSFADTAAEAQKCKVVTCLHDLPKTEHDVSACVIDICTQTVSTSV